MLPSFTLWGLKLGRICPSNLLAKIFIDNHKEKRLLSQEVVSLSDKANILLNRREIMVLFKEQAGKLTRIEASGMVAEKFGLSKNCIIPMNMKSERGKRDLVGTFYAFNSEEETKSQLPRYRLLRKLSREERRKLIDEEKAAKLKAKQASSSEAKG
jgi:small subunit ribosomal protein S24e